MESTRLDKWLWAVRLYKTRAAATEACRAGHVRLNGARAKPAATVRVGDEIRARAHGHEQVVEVARIIDKRVGAAIAAACRTDRTPPPPAVPAAPVAVRGRGAGRPSKRERRQLDRLRGRRR